MDFHQKVYEGYLKIKDKFPNRIVVINGEQSKEEVKASALAVVLEFLKRNANYEK